MSESNVPYSVPVKLNYPNKVLTGSVDSIQGKEYWPYPNQSDDPWYQGSVSRRFYRWSVTLSVNHLSHGSHLTRNPFEYNGLDINRGDWIAGASDGKACKIISVEAKTKNFVECVVEDELRYNTFKSPNGVGIFGGGAVVIFSLNEDGMPILDPIPAITSKEFPVLVSGRFQYLNPQNNVVLEKQNHNFQKGDVISVTPNGYVLAGANTADTTVGVVTESGPGPNQFMVMPNNMVYEFDPGIPGTQGEYIYVDDSGLLSNVSGTSKKAVFLNIRNSVPTLLQGTQPDPVVKSGYDIRLNNIPVTITGAGTNATLTEIASDINAKTSDHFVTARADPAPNTITSDVNNTFYGLVGGYPPFAAAIDNGNGVQPVNFSTSGSQYANVASPVDIKTDIDSVNIPNLIVEATDRDLVITDRNGNNIVITNITSDAQNNVNFAGPNSITGFSNVNGGPNTNRLSLERLDGGEILIYESSDMFQANTGIFSGHTGSLPLAMNIEQGVRTGGIYVVSDIQGRDNLTPLVGDQAYVVNSGNGEWALFQYTGSSWIEIGNLDSAATDARTHSVTYDLPVSDTVVEMGNISPGRKINEITVDVNTAFDAPANIIVGTSADPDQFLTADETDLEQGVTYLINTDYVYADTNTPDITIQATLNINSATTGNVIVSVTYI